MNTSTSTASNNQKRDQNTELTTQPKNKVDKRKYKKRTHKSLYQSTIKFTAASITSSSSAKIRECPVCNTNNPSYNNTCIKCQGEIKLQTKANHNKIKTETNRTNINQHSTEKKKTTTKPQEPITKHKKQDKRKRDKNVLINIQEEQITLNRTYVLDLKTPGTFVKGNIIQTLLKQAQQVNPTNKIWIAPAALINVCITHKNQPLKTKWTSTEQISIQPYKTNRFLNRPIMRRNTPPTKEITAIIINKQHRIGLKQPNNHKHTKGNITQVNTGKQKNNYST